jgi:hypothetical protein
VGAVAVFDVLDVEFGTFAPRAERFAFLRLSSLAFSLQISDLTKPWSVSRPSQMCDLLGISDILRNRRGVVLALGSTQGKAKVEHTD